MTDATLTYVMMWHCDTTWCDTDKATDVTLTLWQVQHYQMCWFDIVTDVALLYVTMQQMWQCDTEGYKKMTATIMVTLCNLTSHISLVTYIVSHQLPLSHKFSVCIIPQLHLVLISVISVLSYLYQLDICLCDICLSVTVTCFSVTSVSVSHVSVWHL